MLVANCDSNNLVGFTKGEMGLLETYRSKISLHRAKAGYSYPSIRLPHTFSLLAGLPTRIYQTLYDGALAFFVLVSSRKDPGKSQSLRLHTAEVAGSNPAEPIVLLLIETRSAIFRFLSCVLRCLLRDKHRSHGRWQP